MKNIVCPVSSNRISNHIPRINAGLVVSILILYAITHFWIIPIFLVVDFYTRGFGNGKYSILGILSSHISELLPREGKQINNAPKIFAARLGFVFTSAIILFHFTELTTITSSISYMLILLAGLECISNFCVGCWIYTFFVQPFYKN